MFKYFFVGFLICFLNGHAQEKINTLKSGDLLFQNGECGELCIAINKVTPAIYGKHFSHVGLVSVEQNGIFVIEATGDSVQKNTLKTFLSRTQNPVLVGRLKQNFQALIPEALAFSEQQIGVPYDDDFLYDNGKYYCSELVYDAFKNANKIHAFFELFPMTFKAPGSDAFFPGWVKYYEAKGMEVPEGKLGCNPGGIGQSDKIDIYIYDGSTL